MSKKVGKSLKYYAPNQAPEVIFGFTKNLLKT